MDLHNYEGMSPWVRILFVWRNLDRVSPLLWTFIFSILLWVVGANILAFRLFAWMGCFVFLFFVAVAVAIFCNLS